jgi:hypothetical protein
MAFTMLFCAKLFRTLYCTLVFLVLAQGAHAMDISVREPQLLGNDEGYVLVADFNINFNSRLEEALNKGVVLYFTLDFELNKSRWYWLDEQVVRKSRTFQLSYHALTRQYRLSTGALHQTFSSQEDVLRMLSRVRNWQVVEKGALKSEQTYLAGLRIYLDLAKMPKTFQVGALSNKDWNLSSDWQRWRFAPAEVMPAVSPASLSPLPEGGGSVPASGTALPATGEAR